MDQGDFVTSDHKTSDYKTTKQAEILPVIPKANSRISAGSVSKHKATSLQHTEHLYNHKQHFPKVKIYF